MQQTCCRFRPPSRCYRPDGYWYEPTATATTSSSPTRCAAVAALPTQKFTRNRALTTFFAEVEPLKGLRFRTNVGADLIFDNFNAFRPSLGCANSPRTAPLGLAGATATATTRRAT